jgi:hypothetical protein
MRRSSLRKSISKKRKLRKVERSFQENGNGRRWRSYFFMVSKTIQMHTRGARNRTLLWEKREVEKLIYLLFILFSFNCHY